MSRELSIKRRWFNSPMCTLIALAMIVVCIIVCIVFRIIDKNRVEIVCELPGNTVSVYDDYDDKVVTSYEVESAVRNFESKAIVEIINSDGTDVVINGELYKASVNNQKENVKVTFEQIDKE